MVCRARSLYVCSQIPLKTKDVKIVAAAADGDDDDGDQTVAVVVFWAQVVS